MRDTHTQLKALVLMLIFILGVTVFERADTIAYYLNSEQNVANIFNPVAAFLGIPVGRSDGGGREPQYESLTPTTAAPNDGDAGFAPIPLNSPSPDVAANKDLRERIAASDAGTSASGSLGGSAPTFLCLPDVVDGGEEAILMWACRDDAYKAVGEGFDTGDATIGAARVAPSQDTTYTLTCVNNVAEKDNTVGECAVRVAKTALALIATPSRTSRGGTVTLSWKTKDTNSCVVTSDRHPSFERSGIEGDAVSPALTTNTIFTLTCESVTGVIEERSITVSVR